MCRTLDLGHYFETGMGKSWRICNFLSVICVCPLECSEIFQECMCASTSMISFTQYICNTHTLKMRNAKSLFVAMKLTASKGDQSQDHVPCSHEGHISAYFDCVLRQIRHWSCHVWEVRPFCRRSAAQYSVLVFCPYFQNLTSHMIS